MSGLYVNTNIPSITAQNQLQRNMAGLSEVLTRLSTGLRLNSGKDDPAGLIASELMKSDMTATTKAISNVQRANSMVAIADSALGQISSLLNDIKGLINEAASTATMTYEQLLANQLQVDAALDSIDRIAKTTNYLGKNILDGSLDFTTRGVDRRAINSLNIYQANFGTRDEFEVGINVIADAGRAQLFYDKAGVSVDTVFEIVGNDGSSLVKVAGGQGVDSIADAINLVSDSTGVRAVVGRDATHGQIFLTSAGLDNDINLTALMAGAAAGNYTVKFTAGNTDFTTYTITDPQNGNPGVIDFQLRMQPNVAPYAEKLDEAYNGIFTYDIAGTGPGNTLQHPNIVVQTTNGQQIRHIEYVQSAGPNPSIPGGVAATFDRVTGKLQIQYDASGNLTESHLARAINAIDGFEYMGIFDDTGKIPSVNVSTEIGGTGTSGMFFNHTDPSLNTSVITFTTTGTDNAVSVSRDGTTGAISVTKGSAATWDNVLDALNASGSWAITNPGVHGRPLPNSFKLVDAGGLPAKGTDVIPATYATASATLSATVVDSTTMVKGRTEINATDDIHLQTTHVDWNPLSITIAGGGVTGSGIVVGFNRGTGLITVTVEGTFPTDDYTYDDILAALKKTSDWNVTTGTGTFTVPPALGISWVDGNGQPALNTGRNTMGDPLTQITAVTNIAIDDVAVSPATAALQNWLAAAGTGTKSAFDMRANNAINITAAVPGTKFENTDVVYVKAEGNIFTESFRLGHQNVYLATNADITDYGDYSIEFSQTNAATTTAVFDGNVLRVSIANGATVQQVLTAINIPTTPPALPANWGGFSFVDPTQAPINQSQSASSLVGTTLNLSNVQMNYSDTPTKAAATITLNANPPGTTPPNVLPDGSDVTVQMRFVADTVGTQFNDVSIVFEQDDSFKAGDVTAVYDAARKILHIRGQVDGADAATYGALKAAVEACSPFKVDVTTTHDNKAYALSNKLHGGLSTAGDGTTGLTQNSPRNSATIKTGQYVGDVGGNNQTLYITVAPNATANDVVDAFRNARGPSAQIAANFIVSNSIDNNGDGFIFHSVFDRDINVRVYAGALTGGNSGLQTDVTAKELVELINNDAILSKLFRADVARGQVGNGFLTLFDEAAYYGSTLDDNALQFLGPKDSPDILFVIDGPNSQLGLSFVDNYGSGCITDDRPVASLNATNINAAFSVQALLGGSEYDDMVVRMIRLDNNHTAEDSYAKYKSGPSNAMAYVSIVSDARDGTMEEQGKLILYANQGGDKYNDVDIVAVLDVNQNEPATAYYCELTKRLIVTVNSSDVELTEAVAAINNEGTFQAEYDYSFNTDPLLGAGSNGPGIATFSNLFSAATFETVIGNTGNTGGRKGGVLEVYVGGQDHEITAQRVIDTINNGPTVKSLFSASPIGGTDAGTGIIHFRDDNIQRVIGSDGKWRNEVNMVTGILGSDENATSYMVVHLATDANGNSITTARDLVKFFDQLTVEQTRGISVSVVRPNGVDNLDRVWIYDECGNVIEEQLCDDLYGFGLLQPTYMIDDCYEITYFPIEFFSYGQDIRPGNAYGSVIAQNGRDASLDIRAKVQGPDFNGVGFKYVKLSDPTAEMYAEYNGYNKMITVFIHEGTTASQVKQIIETSEQTRNLFEVSLPGNGSGVVSLQDNYLLMKGGLHDIGYRGGAAMLHGTDADAHRLILESLGEGARQFVSLRWLDGGDFVVKDAWGNTTDTANGSDMIATINGMRASADGRSLSLESAMLKLGVILDERVGAGDRINFTITGGGAVVQMGTDVVSNQQMRFAIQSVNTANLGGASGRLYQLRTGEIADLVTSDASRRLADRIINEAIMSVSQTRGRLGAIQRNTLEPQINALQDSLVALSSAEAQISNADFAEESSRLTRAQILVQAGTRTLSIANQFPQYAASLLGG